MNHELWQKLGKLPTARQEFRVRGAHWSENHQLACNFRRNESSRTTAHPSIIRIGFSASTWLEFVSYSPPPLSKK